jgi:pseudouridylate synthase
VSRGFSGLLVLQEEVERALIRSQPVVALETSLVAHGLPHPLGVEVARSCEERVRAQGAVPATVAVVDGAVRVGLDDADLERLATAEEVRKVGPRDLASCVIGGGLGATTVGGTLAACRIAGIHFMATGGIGGVHRGWERTRDVSADIHELAIAAVCVVCSGAKALLDIPATMEEIETYGIPLIGYRTDTLPLFYQRESDHPLSDRADDAASIAAVAAAHWGFARTTGVIVANPVAPDVALAPEVLEPAIATSLDAAARNGVSGGEVTPFLLSQLHELTGGATLEANRRLVEDNATVAAEIASCYFAE